MEYKKTFQYRLRPTPDQLVQIEQAAGAVRFVYNWGTDLVRKASEKRDPIPNYYVLAKNLTHLKRESDKTWLQQAYNASLQNGLKDLDLSVKAFFRELKKKNRVGLPGFRKKGFNESIRFSSGIKQAKGKFYIPKIGFVSYHDSRPLQGKIKQATVCKIIDKWFINVVCDVPISGRLMPKVSSSMPNASSMPVSNDVRLIPNASNATNPKTSKQDATFVTIDDAKPQEEANLVLNNANNELSATIESTANATTLSCVISLGAGFLDRVLEVDATLDKPKSKKKKTKRAKSKVPAKVSLVSDDAKPCTNTLTDYATGHAIATSTNSATTIIGANQENSRASSSNPLPDANVITNENQVVEMIKETRDSLRALCKQYGDVFVSIDNNVPMDHQMLSELVRKGTINLSPKKSLSKQANRLLVRRQKKLSRSERSSKNREKARVTLEKQHLKIRRRRNDFLHKLSYKLVQQYDCITIKKYDLKRIMLSAYTPLAKVLRDKSWDKFIQYLQYKSVWYGKKFILT